MLTTKNQNSASLPTLGKDPSKAFSRQKAFGVFNTLALGTSTTMGGTAKAPTPGATKLMESRDPLIRAVSPILLHITKARRLLDMNDISEFRSQTKGLFEEALRDLKTCEKYSADELDKISYLLCAYIDEAVLNTSWGIFNGWAQHNFLSYYHSNTQGGEVFFEYIDSYLGAPKVSTSQLEMLYLMLATGFRGMMRFMDDGEHRVDLLQQKIYQMSISHTDSYTNHLNQIKIAKEKRKKFKIPYFLKLTPIFGIIVLAALFLGLEYSISSHIQKSAFYKQIIE